MQIANIADMLALHGRQRPWQTAIVHGSASMNYQNLDLQVSRRAAMLQAFGVGPGDIVGIALEDSIEHLLMLYAVARAGAAGQCGVAACGRVPHELCQRRVQTLAVRCPARRA